ncbi:TetR/AcrR family transcriptional regulator [Roseibium sp. M-1]
MPLPLSRSETKDARREHIVEVAAACFIEKGFHQTSIRDIARAAKVSLGNIYNHFAGKAELIAEIARLEAEELASLQETLSGASDQKAALETFVADYLAMCSTPANAALTIEILSEAMRNPDISTGFLKNREELLRVLETTVGKLRPKGSGKDGLSHRTCAEFLLDLVEGLALRVAFAGRLATPQEVRALKTAVQNMIMPAGT